MEYKKGTLLQEYFLNPHFKPTEEEQKYSQRVIKAWHIVKNNTR